jgi:hypothetical protein
MLFINRKKNSKVIACALLQGAAYVKPGSGWKQGRGKTSLIDSLICLSQTGAKTKASFSV